MVGLQYWLVNLVVHKTKVFPKSEVLHEPNFGSNFAIFDVPCECIQGFAFLITLNSSRAGSFCNCPFRVETSLCIRKCHCFRYWNRFVHHPEVRHGNLTSVRDVVLVGLLLSVCFSDSLRFNVYVLMILL